jgi:hypothetical protein
MALFAAKFLLAATVVVILPLTVIRELGRSFSETERIPVPKTVGEAGYTSKYEVPP